jgi:hypothetical protein
MLRVQLQMLADTAPDYTDAERALGAYRARRRRRVVAGASAAAVVALIIVYLLPHPSPIAHEPSWIVPAGPVEPSYPPEVRLGPSPVPALPDGNLGPALLAAQTSAPDQCAPACPDAVLFTVAGGRYALAEGFDGSLSPDGRWLLESVRQSAYVLRDLTADRPPQPLDADASSRDRWQPMTWSPDSRWLLLWRPRNGTLNDYLRVEVATGRAVTGTLPPGEQLLAVLASGDLLTGPAAATSLLRPDPVTLRILDPDDLRERARVTLADTVLAADRTVANGGPAPALVMPDGRSVVLTLNSTGNLTVLATVDLRTGHLVRGQALPDGWRPVAAGRRGVVVTTTTQNGQEPIDTVIGVIEAKVPTSPSNGAAEPTVITRVIRGGTVMLRGGGPGWG